MSGFCSGVGAKIEISSFGGGGGGQNRNKGGSIEA